MYTSIYPVVFSFCVISLTMILSYFYFPILHVFVLSVHWSVFLCCCFVLFFFWSPFSLSVLLLLWTFLPENVCAFYSVFMCLWPCIHGLCDSYSSAWHWGYVQMHVREWVHIWPFCYSWFLHVMVQCTLDVIRVCCIDWNVKMFTHCLLYYCCARRSSCQDSDVLITLCLYTVDDG